MGQITTYTCDKCGNTVELDYGIGKMWHSFDKSMFYPRKEDFGLNFYDYFTEDELKDIHKFIEEEEDVIISEAYMQPYICNKCGKIESKLYFKMQGKNKTYKLRYTCECGGSCRKFTNKDLENLKCNKCGGKMFETEEIMWD